MFLFERFVVFISSFFILTYTHLWCLGPLTCMWLSLLFKLLFNFYFFGLYYLFYKVGYFTFIFHDCIILLQLFEAQLFFVYFMKHMYMIKVFFCIIWNNWILRKKISFIMNIFSKSNYQHFIYIEMNCFYSFIFTLYFLDECMNGWFTIGQKQIHT